jgi:Family of unknown function (DUF6074)
VALLAFPLKHRHAFVRRLAAQMLTRKAADGERHLEAQLRRQAVSMARKGFSDDVARRETASLEAAVRREIWRIVLRVPPPSTGGNGTRAHE